MLGLPLIALAVLSLGLSGLGLPGSGDAAYGRAAGFRLPRSTQQLVVATALSWESSEVTLRRFALRRRQWVAVGPPWAGRIAPKGLAWGRGLHPIPPGTPMKREGDRRAPAGVFRLGPAFGYDAAWADRTKLPFVAVGERDVFDEDPASATYNQHVRLDHDPRTPWEQRQQMVQADPAHALQVFVQHNTNPTVAGGGSAIFLHVWRTGESGATKTTTGCTTMARSDIDRLVEWLDPAREPLYVLLPEAEYSTYQQAWDLPPVVFAGSD